MNSSAVSYAKILGANDRVRVGLCGFSERSRDALLPAFHLRAAHIEAGYSHSVALCMTIAAIQSGARVTFDDSKQQVMVAGSPWPRG